MKRRDLLILGTAAVAINGAGMADDIGSIGDRCNASDLARLLVQELADWHRNLGQKNIVPRAFTGVTATGKQAVVVLTGMPLDHIQRRQFLVWLCRKEQFVGYAYSTQVGVSGENGTITEALDIYASSAQLDVSKTMLIERGNDGKISFVDQHDVVLPPKSDNGLFLGLQRSTADIPSQDQDLLLISGRN